MGQCSHQPAAPSPELCAERQRRRESSTDSSHRQHDCELTSIDAQPTTGGDGSRDVRQDDHEPLDALANSSSEIPRRKGSTHGVGSSANREIVSTLFQARRPLPLPPTLWSSPRSLNRSRRSLAAKVSGLVMVASSLLQADCVAYHLPSSNTRSRRTVHFSHFAKKRD